MSDTLEIIELNDEIGKLSDELEEQERHIKEADFEIERLNNIIKEVREYIQDRYDGEALTHTFDKCNVKELLEILKGE